MADEPKESASSSALGNISADEWAAAYAAHVVEYPASRFVINGVGANARLVFGHLGPPLNEAGDRGASVFHFAVTMSGEDMVALRDLLVDTVRTESIDAENTATKSNDNG